MNHIKELRKSCGLTQAELARKLTLKQTSVSRWEQGACLPDTDNLLKLSEIFNVSTDYILGVSDYYYPEKFGRNNLYTAEEHQIIEDYRKLSAPLRETLKQTLKTFLSASENKE